MQAGKLTIFFHYYFILFIIIIILYIESTKCWIFKSLAVLKLNQRESHYSFFLIQGQWGGGEPKRTFPLIFSPHMFPSCRRKWFIMCMGTTRVYIIFTSFPLQLFALLVVILLLKGRVRQLCINNQIAKGTNPT